MDLNKLDLSEYVLIQPNDIKKVDIEIKCYDIEVEDDNSFFIISDNKMILSHNCDGYHITSLLINLFYKWFKYVINQNKLFILMTPLVSVDVGKERKYFYSIKDFLEYKKVTKDKFTNHRYLKGLGSLSVEDWEVIMKKRDYFRVYDDSSAEKFLWIAFDATSTYRKKWLEGTL